MRNIALHHFKENILTTLAPCTLHLRALKNFLWSKQHPCVVLFSCYNAYLALLDLLNLAESQRLNPWRKGTDV